MCSHFEGISDRQLLKRHFQLDGVAPDHPSHIWPDYPSLLLRRPKPADHGDDAIAPREAILGSFGLIPHWARDSKIARHTYNARSETVAQKPSFRDAWNQAQYCIVPAQAFYEPDWRSGKAVATRISRADGKPMGIAGLWSCWRSHTGDLLHSFTLLTLNADAHPLMNLLHKPSEEKRMVLVLPEHRYDDWLHANPRQGVQFFAPYPAEALKAEAAQPSQL